MPTIQIAADGDTHIASFSPTSNYSGTSVVSTNQHIAPAFQRNALLELDLSAYIPAGSAVNYCRYYFKINGTVGLPTTLSFYDVTEPLLDITLATWLKFMAGVSPIGDWATPGGDFGSVRATKTFTPVNGIWYYVDLTTWTQNRVDHSAPLLLGITNSVQVLNWWSNEATIPADAPYFQISYTIPSMLFSGLGVLKLGRTALGSAPMQAKITDSITITETDSAALAIGLDDSLLFLETINGITYAYFNESILITEAHKYLSDYLAGIKGTLAVVLDITAADYCQTIQESGQVFYLNGTPERAHIFTKQTSQKFDIDEIILPGDAVMFTCPDLAVAVGDIVLWDGKQFNVAASINHYFANNIIYVKHALQRVRYTQPVPQVLALVASENLKGKTTLTWDAVDFPTFDHYEIWESPDGGATADAIGSVSDTGPGTILIQTNGVYTAGKYLAGGTISIQGSNGNDGDYLLAGYQDNAGFDELVLTLTKAWDITGALGNIVNATKFYKIDTAKTNGLTVKNLTANTVYYFIVRAVDKYGNPGWWSNQAATPVNATAPTKPEGLR